MANKVNSIKAWVHACVMFHKSRLPSAVGLEIDQNTNHVWVIGLLIEDRFIMAETSCRPVTTADHWPTGSTVALITKTRSD